MPLPPQQILLRLGCGASIAEVCAAAGMTRGEFDHWWHDALQGCVLPADGTRAAPVQAPVRIERDALGIPHIFAWCDADLFFGFGFAMAQDRLFQLDYLRRPAPRRRR